MKHLIDKDALVVMIKSRMATNKHENPLTASAYVEDEDILEAIDTLEVKEVDLEKESLTLEDIDLLLDITDQIANDDSMEERLNVMSQEEYCKEVLKRFKAQKGEYL